MVFVTGLALVTILITAARFAGEAPLVRFFDNAHWTVGYLAGAILAWIGVKRSKGALRRTRRWFAVAMSVYTLGQVLWGIAFGWRSLTGGDDGLPSVPRPRLPLPWPMTDGVPFYYFVLVFFVLAVGALALIVTSPFGRALVGIRESERRMEVLGYDVWRYKYVAFVLAGVFAGLAGNLFVYFNGFVSPSYLSLLFSASALLMVILGGSGTLLGPTIGAAVIVGLENIISGYMERWVLVLGVIYVLVTLFAPTGLVGLARRRLGHGAA